jgi:hypothetical protein
MVTVSASDEKRRHHLLFMGNCQSSKAEKYERPAEFTL